MRRTGVAVVLVVLGLWATWAGGQSIVLFDDTLGPNVNAGSLGTVTDVVASGTTAIFYDTSGTNMWSGVQLLANSTQWAGSGWAWDGMDFGGNTFLEFDLKYATGNTLMKVLVATVDGSNGNEKESTGWGTSWIDGSLVPPEANNYGWDGVPMADTAWHHVKIDLSSFLEGGPGFLQQRWAIVQFDASYPRTGSQFYLDNVQLTGALHPGDANGDGKVSVGDLGILAANYGKVGGGTWAMGDFNNDGNVSVGDLGILAANYGWGTVPEPLTLSLLGLGVMGLTRRWH